MSALGSWMQVVAAGWLAYEITGSAAAVGVLTVVSKGPGLLLSTEGGELADRFDRRRLVAVAFAAQAVPAALLAVLAWEGTGSVLALYAPVLAMGIANALSNAASQVLVVDTVPQPELRRATGIASVTYNGARLAGPAIGGAIVALDGPGACFAVNAASFALAIPLVLSLPAPDVAHGHGRQHLTGAVGTAIGDRRLRALMAIALTFSVVVAPIQELAPVVARSYGHGAHLLGFMIAGLAAGGLIGNVLRTWLDGRVDDHVLLGGALIGAGAMFGLVGVTAPTEFTIVSHGFEYALTLIAMLLIGAAWDVLFVITLTDVQLERRELSGTMTGLYFALALGGVAGGAVTLGLLIDAISVGGGLLLAASLLLLAGLLHLRHGLAASEQAPEAGP